jgi:hypothetical protein
MAIILCAMAVTLVGAWPVAADPPVYAGYTAVDPEPYLTYFTYGGDGVQFTTPTGLMCRIVVISRGQFAYAECFGKLAGVGDSNYVEVTTQGAATYFKESLSQFLTREGADAEKGVHTEPASATDFRPLPAGHSITYSVQNFWSGTCAVDTDTTRCTVGFNAQSGAKTKSFVLSPSATTTS